MRSHFRRPSPALVVSLIALFVALGGTGYAAVKINGKDLKNKSVAGGKLKNKTVTGGKIKNKTITGAKVKDNSLTGTQINESTLAQVPSAASANTVAGTSLDGLLRTTGCQTGKVRGAVRVLGEAGSFPTTYSTSSTFRDTVFNCSGAEVEVRRAAAGRYFVRFIDNPATLAVGQNNIDIDGQFAADHDTIVNVGRITAGPDAGAFIVESYDVTESPANVNAVPDDADFTLLLP
jgi:hypothetical protein